MQQKQLPWELEEMILSLIPRKSLARFRCVCKQWNSLISDTKFVNNHLSRARPQFILLSESKFCSVDIDLDRLSLHVYDLPSDIPRYRHSMGIRVEYCEGLLVYITFSGIGICNPWLKQNKWIKSKMEHCGFNGMGYDNSKPEKYYKIFYGNCPNQKTLKGNIIGFRDDGACNKTYECAYEKWSLSMSYYSVSYNGSLYWVALNGESREHFIQSFDFSREEFKPYCILPGKNDDHAHARALAIFKGDRFSFLEQNYDTRNIEIWVTNKNIKNNEVVEWINFMNVLVPAWSSLKVSNYPPSYFIDEDDKIITSLVICCYDKEGKACVYIAKGDEFHEIKINDLVDEYQPPHRTYFPSFVQVPMYIMKSKNVL